jgi:hypothetical protein
MHFIHKLLRFFSGAYRKDIGSDVGITVAANARKRSCLGIKAPWGFKIPS